MRAARVVVVGVSGEDAPQEALVYDDDVVEALAADGPDQALDVGIRLSSRLHRSGPVTHKPFASRIPSIRCMGVRFS